GRGPTNAIRHGGYILADAVNAILRWPTLRWIFGVIAVAFAVLANAAPPQPNLDGTWSAVFSWPMIPIHEAMTPDGRVLTYGSSLNGQQGAYFVYDVWNPSAGFGANSHVTLQNMTLTDIFCSSQVVMPDNGDVLVVGGDVWNGTFTTNTGNNNVNIFDPS